MTPHLIRLARLFLLFLVAGSLQAVAARGPIHVVHDPRADSPQQLAVAELIERLQRMYPQETFTTAAELPPAGPAIIVGDRSAPLLHNRVDLAALTGPESFIVRHIREQGRDVGLIAGADSRGVVYGIYALLEKLGCGFFLSTTTEPPPRTDAWSFDAWSITDAPLVPDRITLNWHNFLSSATTWEYEDWERYLAAAVRMRFNDLMVHAYGNNPMFTFNFNGITKPVGYFASTQHGRDWGTQHVNDVRRMIGGKVFSEPVFGASIARGDPARRTDDAVALMRRVFANARARGLGVTFALDVDTASANPQEIIASLPSDARFRSGNYELANPDTSAGFAYYQAQVAQLLTLYPDITRIAVWFRDPTAKTPWRQLKRSEMPAAWHAEFAGPEADVSAFALAKVVHAFERALKKLGRTDVQLAAGSWAFPFLEASDRYVSPTIPLIALDWWVSFDSARAQRDLRRVKSGRKVIPIVWAHHDDRTYIGRSYTPYVDFASKLQRIHAAGFGVIHWTTRPLDLYFRSTSRQTWQLTRDEPLEDTCADMAARMFGESSRVLGGRYLFSWVTEAPMFGRETTAHFIDHPLPTPELHAQLGQERLGLLGELARVPRPPEADERLGYFAAYEKFMLSFFRTHTAVERARDALKHHNVSTAREELQQAQPAAVIADYVAAAQHEGITPGEKAIIVSLNLRWLPDMLSVWQAAGLEPARYRLGTVLQEPLAQGAAPNTYYFDEYRQLWKVIDRASSPPTLRLSTFSGEPLAAGDYSINGAGRQTATAGMVEVKLGADGETIVIEPLASP